MHARVGLCHSDDAFDVSNCDAQTPIEYIEYINTPWRSIRYAAIRRIAWSVPCLCPATSEKRLVWRMWCTFWGTVCWQCLLPWFRVPWLTRLWAVHWRCRCPSYWDGSLCGCSSQRPPDIFTFTKLESSVSSTSSLTTQRMSNRERIGSVSSTFSLKLSCGLYLPYMGLATAITAHRAFYLGRGYYF